MILKMAVPDSLGVSALPPAQYLLLGLLGCFVYAIVLGVYRLWFHPLAKFPGPRTAALTFCYEFFYEVFPYQGRYMWKIKELHEQYGEDLCIWSPVSSTDMYNRTDRPDQSYPSSHSRP